MLFLELLNELSTCSFFFIPILPLFFFLNLRAAEVFPWGLGRIRECFRFGLLCVSRVKSGKWIFGFLILHDEQLELCRRSFRHNSLLSQLRAFGLLFRLRHFCCNLFGFYLLLLLLLFHLFLFSLLILFSFCLLFFLALEILLHLFES